MCYIYTIFLLTNPNQMLKKLLVSTLILLNFHLSSFAQYCTTGLHPDCSSDYISAVSIAGTTLSSSSVCNNTTDGYFLFTGASNTATLTTGFSYTFSVTALNSSIISIWIDFNQDQSFDASEWTQVTTASNAGLASSVIIPIPSSALNGITRMRVRSRATSNPNGAGDACTGFGSGECEDYNITISGGTTGTGCIATSMYPASAITGPSVNGTSVVITPSTGSCNYSGEYSVVSINAGNYTLTSSISTDYFTVVNASTLAVVATGMQPLTFTAAASGSYQCHIFKDIACTLESVCRGVTITKNGVASTPPTVTSTAASAITTNSATCGGNVTSAGTATVTARGICFSLSANPTISNSTVASGSGTGVFSANLTGLISSTLYHYRAYATSSVGTSYGADLTFTTTAPVGCIATGQYPSGIVAGPTANGQTVVVTATSVTCNYSGEYGEISLGIGTYTLTSSTVTDYFTVTNLSNVILFNGMQPLTFSISVAGTYRSHIFSSNACIADNNCRGVSITKNSSSVPPVVSTTAATAITAGGATSGGNVTSAGSAAVTARGVCYGTSANPTIAGTKVVSGSGTGVFTANLTGLATGTLYHTRAYATSTAGTAYGADLTFTTVAQALPSVSTTTATAINTTTASSGGNVTSIGGSAVTSRGVCYATTTNPTLANTVLSGGSGAGIFTSSLVGLNPNTTYYVRAYATNTAGTAYGNQITFTTANPTPPSVLTIAATAVSYFTATTSGNVTSIGTAAVTDRGICYSTTPSPTTANAHISNGTGTGTFTIYLSGLAGSTTYHYRAYATNSVGTTYGADLTFTTLNPCINSTEVYLTNLAFVDAVTANQYSTYFNTYLTPNAQGLPGLPGTINPNPANPYNFVNPGPPIRFKAKCYNNKTNGTSIVSGLCKLRTTDPNITITDSTAGLNNVGWHNEAWSTDEFEFSVSNTVFTSYTAYVEVVVVEGPNSYYTKCIPIPIRAFALASLNVDDDNNPDSFGNSNGVAENTETVEFLPYINNASTFSASYVAGFVENYDYLSNVSIWSNHPGSSGNVYAQGWWNYSFAQPQPIPAGTTNTQPEYDFVFDYTYPFTYQFNLHLIMAAGFNLLNSPNNLTLMRETTYLPFNSAYPAIPPTGVKAVSSSVETTVYPNPFNNEISVVSKAGLTHSKYTITNALGMIVAEGKLEAEKSTLNLEHLATGLYTLNIVGQASIKISKK